MSIESNEPPDPPFDMMTSADDIVLSSLNGSKDKVGKNKNRKPLRGIKVSTPGSAGAISVLRRLRSAKVTGKARGRADESPGDNRGGKRTTNSTRNDKISKVLSGLRSGSFNSNLKFSMGHSVDVSNLVCCLNHEIDASVVCNENDGNTSCGFASSKDSIASAETWNVCDREIAGSGTGSEHTNMDDVVSIGFGQTSSQDGIASDKGGSGFVFGKNVNFAGVLKNPLGPVFNVQFSNIVKSNPFGRSSNDKGIGANNGGGNASVGNKLGSTVFSNQFLAVVDRFAEKLKQGSEEMALKMEFNPNFVIKQDSRKRRIEFSDVEIIKGGQACSMQLYGYFVGTSMDYRVVRGNLMRMWRIFDIEDITKTNSGVFYFKFKSEDGMKKVLKSGLWMVQNVPLVLNVWEPGIWLDKTEPSVIPIWVYV
ncbi:hypothetical protein Tco_0328237 [Tanacetum coccineum]